MVATNIINMDRPIAASEACIDDLISVTQREFGVVDDLFKKVARQ
jgi:hypothetical protein